MSAVPGQLDAVRLTYSVRAKGRPFVHSFNVFCTRRLGPPNSPSRISAHGRIHGKAPVPDELLEFDVQKLASFLVTKDLRPSKMGAGELTLDPRPSLNPPA